MIQAATYSEIPHFFNMLPAKDIQILMGSIHFFFFRSSYKYPPANDESLSFKTLLTKYYINQYYSNFYKTKFNIQYRDCIFFLEIAKYSHITMKKLFRNLKQLYLEGHLFQIFV